MSPQPDVHSFSGPLPVADVTFTQEGDMREKTKETVRREKRNSDKYKGDEGTGNKQKGRK
jgi:hypothetical protein